jgi:CRISPR-associated protein Csx14
MKTAVIAPLGMSPPVVSTFIDGLDEPVSDLVLLTTNNASVRAGARLLTTGLARRYPWLRVHTEMLPWDDIATEEQNFKFMSIAAKIFRKERDIHHCDAIYLNVSGGRKNMCMTLSLIGQILQADGVYHIVNRDISVINERLERFRSEIMGFADADDPQELEKLYEMHEADFDHLLFPDRRTYEIIRIPTLPYPVDYLQYLVEGMLERGAGLTAEDRDLLVRHGIFERVGSSVTLTPHGEALLEVILGR